MAGQNDRRPVVRPEYPLVKAFRTPSAAIGQVLSRIRSSQFNRNMGAGSIMALIGTCLSIISYPIYLHYLGYHRYGLWLVLSVVVSVAQLGNLGIPWALMKLVAEDHGHGDWEGVKTYINIGCGIILGVGLIFLIAVILLRSYVLYLFNLRGADAAMVHSMLPYVAMLSVLVLLFSTFNAALGGLGRMDLTSYNETLVQIFIILFCGLLLHLGLDLRAMVLGTLSGYVVAQVISFMQVQRIMPIPLIARTQISSHKTRQLLGTGGWILGGGVCTMMLLPFTRLMLSRYAGLEAVAVNDMCLSGSMRVRNIFDSAFRPMMPEVSSLRVKRKVDLHDRVRSIDRKAFLVIFAFALPTFIGLMIVMNPLLHIWLHRSFNPLLPDTFRIALAGTFASLLGSSAYYMLIGLGRARDAAYSTAIQFAVNAAVLLAIAYGAGHITVGESAMAFGVAAAITTLYVRIRIYLLVRSKDTLPEPLALRGNDVSS
ncbi:MAG TPA: lipopolysaccharide biosynthesis protein [Terracidiphilus sp.]|nr:lipopolysaccharide biosynthesis protein [Terracidiphilus sp.]